jgi:hypothetical protein
MGFHGYAGKSRLGIKPALYFPTLTGQVRIKIKMERQGFLHGRYQENLTI